MADPNQAGSMPDNYSCLWNTSNSLTSLQLTNATQKGGTAQPIHACCNSNLSSNL